MSRGNFLRTKPQSNKVCGLPVGISGPFVSGGKNRVMYAELGVVLPSFGERARVKKIYIASINTYTPDKYLDALAKAITLRAEAVKGYEREAKRAGKHRSTTQSIGQSK